MSSPSVAPTGPGGNAQAAAIQILEPAESDPSSRTFIIKHEDYTLGNPLQFVISKYAEVEFCACTPTHPLEEQMLLRVQCRAGHDARAVFARGLADVQALFAGIREKYVQARDECLLQQQQHNTTATTVAEDDEPMSS